MDESVLRTILQSVELNTTDYLRYNSTIQLTPYLTSEAKDTHPHCLSITPSAFKDTHHKDTINERSAVTLGTNKYPCRRNTFKIIHPEGDLNAPESRLIKFNEDFFLQSCCPRNNLPDSPHMVVYSSNRILDNPSVDVDNYYRFYYTKGNLQQPIALTERPRGRTGGDKKDALSPVASMSCRWRFVHPDPDYRFEYEGEPVTASDPVLILHTATNKFLTPECNRQRLTLLGPETCVSVKYRPVNSKDKLGLWMTRGN